MKCIQGFGIFFNAKNTIKNFSIFFIAMLFVSSILMGAINPLAFLIDSRLLINPFLEIWGIIYILIFSALSAFALGLFFFQLKQTKNFNVQEGILGIFTGISALLTSACPVCSSLLLSVTGLATGYAFLPFGGWELRILSLLLVLGTIFLLTGTISECKECEIPDSSSEEKKECCK